MEQRVLIPKKFEGRAIALGYENDKGEHFVGLSYPTQLVPLSEYLKDHDLSIDDHEFVTMAEHNTRFNEYLKTRVTQPEQIDEERFFEMLEVLPPERHMAIGGWEVFHCMERITGNLVSWFARHSVTKKCYEWEDFDDVEPGDIHIKLAHTFDHV